ncbi:uncharacterized protein LOC128961280 [Oppia nitens]|uniref:uncharacterized protein LOC128961280 n=1 Tax=Oppia nitens TaxID=1686743 RepID=UPI0023D97F4A|nr:uncharacterized protein LOC128961280 [Oppia nitens]
MSTTRRQSMLLSVVSAVVLLSLTVCMVSTTVSAEAVATTNGSQPPPPPPQQQHRSHRLFRRFSLFCSDLQSLVGCSAKKWDVEDGFPSAEKFNQNKYCCHSLEIFCQQNKLHKEGKSCTARTKESLDKDIKVCTDKGFITNEANCKGLSPKDITNDLGCKSYVDCYSDEAPPPDANGGGLVVVVNSTTSSVRLSLWMAITVIVIVVVVTSVVKQ